MRPLPAAGRFVNRSAGSEASGKGCTRLQPAPKQSWSRLAPHRAMSCLTGTTRPAWGSATPKRRPGDFGSKKVRPARRGLKRHTAAACRIGRPGFAQIQALRSPNPAAAPARAFFSVPNRKSGRQASTLREVEKRPRQNSRSTRVPVSMVATSPVFPHFDRYWQPSHGRPGPGKPLSAMAPIGSGESAGRRSQCKTASDTWPISARSGPLRQTRPKSLPAAARLSSFQHHRARRPLSGIPQPKSRTAAKTAGSSLQMDCA